MASIDELKKTATQVWRDVLRMVHGAQSGYSGNSPGCADFMTALYFEVLQYNSKFTMDGINEDISLLSHGHISPIWYSVLSHSSYFSKDEMKTFRQLNTHSQGHPITPGRLRRVRVASGSFGQGVSVACSAALTKKLTGDTHIVYSLHGDGELEEGQNWKAIMFAHQHKIDNLIATVDGDGQQIDCPDKVISPGDLKAKRESFGWLAPEMTGNIMEEAINTLKNAKSLTGKGNLL